MSSNPSTIINSSAPAARILVVGAGSTGGYVGAKLLKAGRDVTFLVRKARAATLRRTGLRLGGLDDLVLDPPVLTADRLDTTFDLVLLAVKATGLDAAVDDGTAFPDCVVAEIAAVTAAAGFPLPQSELDSTAGLLRQRDSGFTSSLYRDVLAGLPTEAEPIIGDLLRRARALSVQTPLLNAAAVQLRVHEHRA